MNKFFVVIMAMCLISVQAFVKREEPTTERQTSLEMIQKRIEGLSKNVAETFDPQAVKAKINDIIQKLADMADRLKNRVSAEKGEKKQ